MIARLHLKYLLKFEVIEDYALASYLDLDLDVIPIEHHDKGRPNGYGTSIILKKTAFDPAYKKIGLGFCML